MLNEAASTPSNILEITGNAEAMLNESFNQVMLSTSFEHFLTLSTNVERMLKQMLKPFKQALISIN